MTTKKKQKKEEETALVRVETPTHEKVKEFVKISKQSIGGFFTIAAEEKLKSQSK